MLWPLPSDDSRCARVVEFFCRTRQAHGVCVPIGKPSEAASYAPKKWKRAIQNKLTELRLTSHPGAQVTPVTEGIPWLGWTIWPHRRRLKARNKVNFTRRLKENLDLYQAGQISFAELDASVQGWINHVRYGDTWGLRRHIFREHPIRGRRG